jgi:hypothetical protein
MAALCLSGGRSNKTVVLGNDYPALLRARRRRLNWSERDVDLYRRHRWRVEGAHAEAKSWHGLARAVRRGLGNVRIQANLTAAAMNLKRLSLRFPGPQGCRARRHLRKLSARSCGLAAAGRGTSLYVNSPSAVPRSMMLCDGQSFGKG